MQKNATSFRTLEIVAVMLAVGIGLIVFAFWRTPADVTKNPPVAIDITFPAAYDQPLLMKMADIALSILPLGAQPAQAAEENNVVTYVNAYTNTDVVQTKSSHKIKEDIILKQPGHPNVFEYQIDLAPFDVSQDETGDLFFFQKGHKDDDGYRRFTIPAPFMIDAKGTKSSTKDVSFALSASGRLVLKPSAQWLAGATYPVILDPTVEITVLNVHSHPQQGENWTVDFVTQGTADLKIIPDDQATIDDDEFVSLSCGGETRQPQLLSGDVISYPNWECGTTATVIHYTKTAGNHTLRFDFGGQIAYAYNTSSGTIIRASQTAISSGGAISYTPGYVVHTFIADGTFTVSQNVTVEYLVVAGGGGGGYNGSGGGGGAGGVRSGTLAVSAGSVTVTIGGGGGANANGGDSVFSSITSTGGGRGGSSAVSPYDGAGGSGGSGGGGTSTGAGGSGTAGQGNNGGHCVDPINYASAGGGGGGGEAGHNTGDYCGGDGGNGTSSSISGAAVSYGGGGGGGEDVAYQAGCSGGGGTGGGGGGAYWSAYYASCVGATTGTANTGGGGGGGPGNGSYCYGASGGSGIVIVRYPVDNTTPSVIFRGEVIFK